MKAVILAGGLGTRISEESVHKPKPMVEIGHKPILWHILKTYSFYGITDFIICCGYKGYMIKEYFANYYLHTSDCTIYSDTKQVEIHRKVDESWKITLVDTGFSTMTGGRLKLIRDYLEDDTFLFTYGDGLIDVNINDLINFHKLHSKEATLTAVQPPGRFGALNIKDNNLVESFLEKPQGDGAWVNGGYFVLEPSVIDRIDGQDTVWEQGPLSALAADNELTAFKHSGFWHPMDTLRDKNALEKLWVNNQAPWKIW